MPLLGQGKRVLNTTSALIYGLSVIGSSVFHWFRILRQKALSVTSTMTKIKQ